MVPPKKMSLQEFFQDESFGGSWADEEIDMASISVPIEKSSHEPSRGFGINIPDSPPFIVKLLNLPISVDDGFIVDLFDSRFTPYVKFKIVTDPSSNILETHVIKQVAFVELESKADLLKALKWHDLFYKGNRKVIVELADFIDFQHCIKFNQDHHEEIQQIQRDFMAQKHQQYQPRHMALLNDFDISQRGSGLNEQRNRRPPPSINTHAHVHAPPPPSSSQPPRQHKANPFGAAKPVDTFTKQTEIEKKLINLNTTTVQTLGNDEDIDIESTIKKFHESGSPTLKKSILTQKKPTVSILKRASEDKPESTNGTGKSLAQLLSEQSDLMTSTPSSGKNTPKNNTPKPTMSKPVILKKKQTTSPTIDKVDLTVKEGEYLKEKDAPLKPKTIETDLEKLNIKEERPDFKKCLDQLVQKKRAGPKANVSSKSDNKKADFLKKEYTKRELPENDIVNNDVSKQDVSRQDISEKNDSRGEIEHNVSKDENKRGDTLRGRGRGRGGGRGRGRGRGRSTVNLQYVRSKPDNV